MCKRQRRSALLLSFGAGLLWASPASAQQFIVKDGEPKAEIVTTEHPIRNVQLAAEELQKYVEKISGAKLPIHSTRTQHMPVHIHVGESAHTERMGLDDTGLDHGAFLMKTVGSQLVLLGKDIDFVPIEPYPKSRGDLVKRVYEEWDKLTGGLWRNPVGSLYKGYNRKYDIRRGDTHGSLNAVYGLLRHLGVRWYMPGKLGEVVPKMKTIPLPKLDQTVKPEFMLRFMSFARYAIAEEDHILWSMRLGLNNPYGYWIAHGVRALASRPEMRKAHPEIYSVFKGQRRPEGKHVCYSSESLLKEQVRFVRALYDIYDFKMVSVMPEDGFSHACECSECMKAATPERTSQGKYSYYVWDYVNRVAKEVYETHPDRYVCCCAYSTYRLPPEKIKNFNPNVVVGIVGGRGPQTVDPESREAVRELQKAWAAKTSTKIFIFENYPFTNRAKYIVPRIFPHGIAQGMKEVKDISIGESIWMGESRGLHAPELNHLNFYVTARLYWDADRDVDKLLEEYYRLFYGPAAKQMKAFVEHCEANFQYLRVNPHPSRKKEVIAMIDKVFDLLGAARRAAGKDTVYEQRICKLGEWLVTLKDMRAQIARGRKNVPEMKIREVAKPNLNLDGKLDDQVWRDSKYWAYRELVKGGEPRVKTFFKAFWSDGALYLGFRCEDPDMANLSITSTKDDDARAWRGDVIELLIETDAHSFYQMVINPDGALVDLDRAVTKNDLSWDSMARVETSKDEAAWYVEMRVPILEISDDPLHNLVGTKPASDNPWYFNFCRQRLREDVSEFSAFSPTGAKLFAKLMKFAKLYVVQ